MKCKFSEGIEQNLMVCSALTFGFSFFSLLFGAISLNGLNIEFLNADRLVVRDDSIVMQMCASLALCLMLYQFMNILSLQTSSIGSISTNAKIVSHLCHKFSASYYFSCDKTLRSAICSLKKCRLFASFNLILCHSLVRYWE